MSVPAWLEDKPKPLIDKEEYLFFFATTILIIAACLGWL